MIRTTRTNASKQIYGINITPFTDICLVLLIIFMVTASTLTRESDFNLNLPKASGDKNTTLPAHVVVKIFRDQHVKVNDKVLPFTSLSQELAYLNRDQNVKILVVRADETVPYGLVIQTINIGRQLGIPRFNLPVREPDDSTPAGVQ